MRTESDAVVPNRSAITTRAALRVPPYIRGYRKWSPQAVFFRGPASHGVLSRAPRSAPGRHGLRGRAWHRGGRASGRASRGGKTRVVSISGRPINFLTPERRKPHQVRFSACGRYLAKGHFLPENLGLKVEAALRFLSAGGEVSIASSDRLDQALARRTGTGLILDHETSIVHTSVAI